MGNLLAKILVYGDPHLCSKNYGAHNNYSKESLDNFRKITKIAEERQVTHLIGLGDFTYGKFSTLEYRVEVESLLERQYKLTNGNHFVLKGNHDVAGYGMTEYDYYIKKGLFKPSCNFDIGTTCFTMVDNRAIGKTVMNVKDPDKYNNIVFAHDTLAFKDSQNAPMFDYIALDTLPDWYGVDVCICGHIHKQTLYKGLTLDNQGHGHQTLIHYPGCLSRPAYEKDNMDLVGQLVYIEVYDDSFNYEIIKVDLLPLKEAFNLTIKDQEAEKKELQESRLDISDIVANLDTHSMINGNPEDIIMNMKDIPEKYRLKAVELLKNI